MMVKHFNSYQKLFNQIFFIVYIGQVHRNPIYYGIIKVGIIFEISTELINSVKILKVKNTLLIIKIFKILL